MMELRRILKPGGLCFTSFLGPNIFEKFTLRPYVENEYGLFAKKILHQDWDKTVDRFPVGGLDQNLLGQPVRD
ncbi:MAG: hypothetical protein U0521_10680 [Anaerolineae bacterium]